MDYSTSEQFDERPPKAIDAHVEPKISIPSKVNRNPNSLANLIPPKKGEVRNPRGRPKKDYDLAALAQAHAQKAINTLVEIMSDTEATPSARVGAASEILDRGFGRAPQTLDVEHKIGFSEQFEEFMRAVTDRRAHRTIDAQVLDAAE